MTSAGGGNRKSLGRGDVHIWHTLLPDLHPHLKLLAGFLSPCERLRADRFLSEKDRIGFTLSHGFLRVVLGSYLGSPAYLPTLSVDAHGRPSLSRSRDGGPLDFNLSHSDEVTLCATGSWNSVGIDVEKVGRILDLDELTASIFTPREQEAFASLPPSRRERAFYLMWVSKEAVLKSLGSGLGIHPREIEVGAVCWSESSYRVQHGTREFFVSTFDCAHKYVAAVAAQSKPDNVKFFRFEVPSSLLRSEDAS